jgi:hypothetical protein
MSYKYDVFISYRNIYRWPDWVSRCFIPKLEDWLGLEFGRKINIFQDSRHMKAGVLQKELGEHLASSRILVPLFSKAYFGSSWCKNELEHMNKRGNKYGISLICAAKIHDGDDFPADAKRLLCLNLEGLANPYMSEKSPTNEKLSEEIRKWAPSVANAIKRAPNYVHTWRTDAINIFTQQDQIFSSKQETPPGKEFEPKQLEDIRENDQSQSKISSSKQILPGRL